jgi:hypothetical protein
MENRIDLIINSLQNNQYPNDGTGASWGVAVKVIDVNPNVLVFHPTLKMKVENAKTQIINLNRHPEVEISAQIIIDFKNGSWVVELNYLDPEKDGWDSDPEYGIVLTFNIAEIRLLLAALIRSGVRIYDVMEHTA